MVSVKQFVFENLIDVNTGKNVEIAEGFDPSEYKFAHDAGVQAGKNFKEMFGENSPSAEELAAIAS